MPRSSHDRVYQIALIQDRNDCCNLMFTVQCFLYGLFSFALAMVVLLRGRRSSQLALGKHFIWLAAFGFLSSLYAWAHIFEAPEQDPAIRQISSLIVSFALPAAGLVLVRFGIGLISEGGHLPVWMTFLPVVLIVPLSLLIAYGLVSTLTTRPDVAVSQWSRYLLIFPGNVLSAVGCVQQWRRLRQTPLAHSFPILLVAATAFLFNALTTGLITPATGLLVAEDFEALTGLSIQLWRMLSIIFLMVSVIGMMEVFEFERHQEIEHLKNARLKAQEKLQQVQLQSLRETGFWLDGLVRISRLIADMKHEDIVLCELVSIARKLARADLAALALREQHSHPTLRYLSEAGGTYAVNQVLVDNPLILDVVTTGKARCFSQNGAAERFSWRTAQQRWEVSRAAVVPLELNGTTIGALWVGRCTETDFSATDLDGLQHLADQAVIALEHGMMTARLQSMAVIAERSRIAREMHDGIAQILGYLGLEMQTLEALVQQGNTVAALKELGQARAEIKAAHADVRQNILSLRTTLSENRDLKDALRTYVQEFAVQTNIDAEYLDETPPDLDLSPLAEVQLIGIVQEALTNVRKHASASVVKVHLHKSDGVLIASIVDNGIGFTDQALSATHFGLQTMRERALDVGGELTIESKPGEGTLVRLRIPISSEQQERLSV